MINITTTVVIIKSGVSRTRLESSFADTMDKAEPGMHAQVLPLSIRRISPH